MGLAVETPVHGASLVIVRRAKMTLSGRCRDFDTSSAVVVIKRDKFIIYRHVLY